MRRLEFEDYTNFANLVTNKFEYLRRNGDDICIVAKYEEMKRVIEEIVRCGYEIHSVQLNNGDFYDYEDEYICNINSICSNGEIWCEPMKFNGKYIEDEVSVAYVFDNCSSTVLKYLDAEEIYEVSVGDDDSEEYDNFDEDYKSITDEDYHRWSFLDEDNEETSTTSESYTINGKSVSKDEYKDFLTRIDNIQDKYLSNIKKMLLNYCDLIDETNEYRRFFL